MSEEHPDPADDEVPEPDGQQDADGAEDEVRSQRRGPRGTDPVPLGRLYWDSPAGRSVIESARRILNTAMPDPTLLASLASRVVAPYQHSVTQAMAQLAGVDMSWQQHLHQVVKGYLDSPQWRSTLEAVRKLADRWLPSNWRGHDVDFDAAWKLAQEGLPLVWVPRGELVVALLAAPDREARQQVLSAHATDIIDDCAAVVSTVTLPEMADYRKRLEQVLAAHRDGHVEAAQALAAVVFTSLLQYAYGHGKLDNVRKSPLRHRGDIDGLSVTRYKAALLVEASLPATRSVGNRVPEAERPTAFNRHATAHDVSRIQYTPTHAVTAIMLATALLAEAQFLVENGILVPNEED